MAKKTQIEIEQDILKEAAAEAQKEKKAQSAERKAQSEKPQASSLKPQAQSAKPTAKEKIETGSGRKTGGVVKEALETVKQMKEGKDEAPKERKIKFERVYTVPIRQLVARQRRTRVAVRNLKNFVTRHTKAKEVKIEQELNEHIWERGDRKPPIRVRVSVSVDEEGLAVVNLKK